MAWVTRVTEALGIDVPVIQAPMGGGPTTAQLVAAVCEAGGLGSVAAGYLPPERLAAEIDAVRLATRRPFAVNVFAGTASTPDPAAVERLLAVLAPIRAGLGLPDRPSVAHVAEDLDAQLEVVLAARPAAVSFTFGVLGADAVARVHDAGCVLIGTATTVAEAVALEQSGVDMVCAQGAEAGAHRGTFLGDPAHALVGTMALVPQVADAVAVPVIASGAVMDGRGLAAALALGAGAVQSGTAFLRCPEAGTAPPYRRALAAATDTSTSLTTKVTGRMARGIDNRLMRELAVVDVPPYPVTNALTAELRNAAAAADDPEWMSLWSGQAAALGTEEPAGDVVRRMVAEAAGVLRQARAGAIGAGERTRTSTSFDTRT